MEQNNQLENRQPCFRKVIGNTTYVVRVHFSETSKERLRNKINRMVGKEAAEQSKLTEIIALRQQC